MQRCDPSSSSSARKYKHFSFFFLLFSSTLFIWISQETSTCFLHQLIFLSDFCSNCILLCLYENEIWSKESPHVFYLLSYLDFAEFSIRYENGRSLLAYVVSFKTKQLFYSYTNIRNRWRFKNGFILRIR